MRSLNGRLTRLEQAIPPAPEADYSKLVELRNLMLSLSKEDKLAWLDAQLFQLEEDSGWCELLTDWKEFLTLKDQNTAADWDRERWCFVDTENSKRWHELDQKWGWCGWTGAGVPPQLTPGHRDFLYE